MKHIESATSVQLEFVSPESMSHCFYLIQSMRSLPTSQKLAEDKLQVKNIIFHAVKNALAVVEAKTERGASGEKKPENGKTASEDSKISAVVKKEEATEEEKKHSESTNEESAKMKSD